MCLTESEEKKLNEILASIYRGKSLEEIKQHLERLLGKPERIIPNNLEVVISRVLCVLSSNKDMTLDQVKELLNELGWIQTNSANIKDAQNKLFQRFISPP